MTPTTRRTVLMGAVVPLAGIPDFSSPLPGAPAPDPDVRLIALCREHEAVTAWCRANQGAPDDDPAYDAGVDRDSELCGIIAAIPARTAAGLTAKARVVAQEADLRLAMEGMQPWPVNDQSDNVKVLASLLRDLIPGPAIDRSAPLIAASSTGITDPSDLASACLWAVSHRNWVECQSLTDEDMNAALDRFDAVFDRAIKEPSITLSDLSAKATLALDDYERFRAADYMETDSIDAIILTVLREVVSLQRYA